MTNFKTPAQNPSFGKEVTDLTLDGAGDDVVATLETLLRRHRVLAQHLSDAALDALSRKLGPNPVGKPFHKTHPEINVISNLVENGQPAGNLGAGEAVWHADMTYQDTPPRAAILHALEVPDAGGNPYFADM